MFAAIYLVFLACLSTQAAAIPLALSQPTNTSANIRKVYQNLYVAEQMIQSAKDIVSKNMQALLPTDCEDLLNAGENKSGVYLVWPKNRIFSGPISVYCDMETDGGGWTVIQRRGNFLRQKDYFYQNWQAYKEGFGNLKEDFWLGNDNIYALTSQKSYSIRFDLGAFDGLKAYAVYSKFWIDDENSNYRLHVSGYSGNAGNSFTHHDNHQFTTKDRDNDVCRTDNCAEKWKGAWWFKACVISHLNGEYHKGKPPRHWEGIIWEAWKGIDMSLATTEMKIRKIPSWIK